MISTWYFFRDILWNNRRWRSWALDGVIVFMERILFNIWKQILHHQYSSKCHGIPVSPLLLWRRCYPYSAGLFAFSLQSSQQQTTKAALSASQYHTSTYDIKPFSEVCRMLFASPATPVSCLFFYHERTTSLTTRPRSKSIYVQCIPPAPSPDSLHKAQFSWAYYVFYVLLFVYIDLGLSVLLVWYELLLKAAASGSPAKIWNNGDFVDEFMAEPPLCIYLVSTRYWLWCDAYHSPQPLLIVHRSLAYWYYSIPGVLMNY